MKLSARLIVAVFCAALIINPIVLLLLFSSATDSAISGIVPAWDGSALRTVVNAMETRSKLVLGIMDAVAEDLLLNASPNGSSTSDPSMVMMSSNRTAGLLANYSFDLSNAIGEASAEGVMEDSYAVGGSGVFSLVLIERRNDSLSSNVFRVTALPWTASASPTSHRKSGSGSTTLFLSLDDLRNAILVFPDLPSRAFLPTMTQSPNSQCENAAAVASNLTQSNSTSNVLKRIVAGLALSTSLWAVKQVTDRHYLILLGGAQRARSPSLLNCSTLFTSSDVNLTTLFVSDTGSSSLDNCTTAVAIATASRGKNVAGGASSFLTANLSSSLWILCSLLSDSLLMRLHNGLPSEFAISLLTANFTTTVDNSGAVYLQDLRVVSCASEYSSGGGVSGSRMMVVGYGSTCSDLSNTVTAAVSSPTTITAFESLITHSFTAQYQSGTINALFGEIGSLFITTTNIFSLSNTSLLTPSADQQAVSLPAMFLVIAVPSSSSRDLLRAASTRSVIASVSLTAFVFVVTLTVLHHMFHPLKVVGTLLRCCADIRLHDLEAQSPSFINEIFQLQKAVDLLIKRIRIIGSCMPDKSQLHSVLSHLQDFQETPANFDKLHDERRQTQSLAAIAHSISIHLEYRSRRDISKQRDRRDLFKQVMFEFVYTAQDKIYESLLEQSRQRLHERIGESLQLYDKGSREDTPSGSETANIAENEFVKISNDEELLDAIERSTDRCLYLAVLKSSTKYYVAWFRALLSVVDFALICNAAVYLFSFSQSSSPSSPAAASESSIRSLEQTGLALILVLVARLVSGVLSGLYLIRGFSTLHAPFAQWVAAALLETLVTVLFCSASITNINLLFSHTRLTTFLRFNAPHSDAFEHRSVRWLWWGITLGEILPLVLCAFAVAQLREFHISTFLGILFPSGSLLLFAFDKYFDRVLSRLHQMFIARSENTSGAVDGKALINKSRGVSIVSSSSLRSAGGERQRTRSLAHETEDTVGDMGGSHSPGSTSFVSSDDPHIPPNRSLYLGLSKRAATVMKISLHRAAAYTDAMDSVEIQFLFSTFLSIAFAEAKSFGGIVLSVSNGEVVIGFNCHQVQEKHFEKSLGCFFSIHHRITRQIFRWSVDQPTPPKVIGTVITGNRYIIGFSGCGETRSFQLIGLAQRELDRISRLGAFYGMTLACNAAAAEELDLRCSNATTFSPQLSFSAATTAVGANLSIATESQAPPLHSRIVDVIRDVVGDHRWKKQPSGDKRSHRSANLAPQNHHQLLPRGRMEDIKIFELRWDDQGGKLCQSSEHALSFLNVIPQPLLSPTTSSPGAPSVISSPLLPAKLIADHITLYPNDDVMRFIQRRFVSGGFQPRNASCIGVEMVASERRPPVPNTADTPVDDQHHVLQADSNATQKLYAKMCTADQYVVYFTNL